MEQLKQFMEVTADEGFKPAKYRRNLHDEMAPSGSSIIFDGDKGIFRGVSQVEKDDLKRKDENKY